MKTKENISMRYAPSSKVFSMSMLLLSITATGLLGGTQTEAPRGTFLTLDVPGAANTIALDINSAGDIVGRYDVVVNGALSTRGFLRTRHGEWVPIDYPGANFTAAAGINARGDIVGTYRLIGEPMRRRQGFLWHDQEFTTIDPPGAMWTNPLGIDSLGRIVGRYCTTIAVACSAEETNVHGFIFAAGEFDTIDFPGATATSAWKIDPQGSILGAYRANDRNYVFILTDSGVNTIDLPNIAAISADNGGINPRGDILLSFCDIASCTARNPSHGLMLRRDDQVFIDVPGASSTVVFGINARGDIVGLYIDAGGQAHAFQYRP